MIKELLFLSLFLSSLLMFGQSANEVNNKHYALFDNYVGIENIGISNGVILEIEYKNIYDDQHQFFKSYDFLSGSVNYNGQSYPDLKLRYDVYHDEILLKLPDSYGAVMLQLLKEKVDYFFIDGHKFLHINNEKILSTGVSGYFEVLLHKGLLDVYKKNGLVKRDVIENRRVFYQFSNKNSYILFYDNIYHNIDGKSDVVKLFPEQKSEIKAFYVKNKALRKLKPDKFIESLFSMIHSHLSKTNTQS
ncbi:hypothetical protein M0D21_17480 [Aquimarina sp. D1M17]|uniref:hypothetical protein n=1 Tax=Aquimarina acroporae TaxID=2937283 RepID=UPI0020BE21C3|nr:hypothetical protein [Aquimarina acroporae]MCK8523377.1 hypothetical protein [Aquimarina acroporae]